MDIADWMFCFVWFWFYGAQTQFRSYGAETGMMTYAYLWCYKRKTTSPARAKRIIGTHYVAYNDLAVILLPQPIKATSHPRRLCSNTITMHCTLLSNYS
jgi:hypothetical protein